MNNNVYYYSLILISQNREGNCFFRSIFLNLEPSLVLEHSSYWGSRQQLMAGKVIADWVDRENGALDPVFGILLQPTAGKLCSHLQLQQCSRYKWLLRR